MAVETGLDFTDKIISLESKYEQVILFFNFGVYILNVAAFGDSWLII